MINIEPLRRSQIDAALQLFQQVLGDHDEIDQAEITSRIENGQGAFYVAIDTATNKIIGLKFGYFQDNTCIGRGIGVHPDYRRHGIATRLLNAFEANLQANTAIENYAFGSATDEGIPFHLAMGYYPRALIQFSDQSLRPKLDLAGLEIADEYYNDTYEVYQIYVEVKEADLSLAHLRALQQDFPETNVQYMFSKKF